MTSITFFFPKKEMGKVLGINAGIGNLGVGTCQIIFPALAAVSILGMPPISEEAKSPFGGQVWPFQSCWILFGLLVIFCAFAYKYMVPSASLLFTIPSLSQRANSCTLVVISFQSHCGILCHLVLLRRQS